VVAGLAAFSPALLILWCLVVSPDLLLTTVARTTSFWADPPSCTVGEPRKSYLGEGSFPLILQNVHRYFLYLGMLLLCFLAHDVWKATRFVDLATGQGGVWHRRRDAGAAVKRRFAGWLCAGLPFAAPPGGRISGSTIASPLCQKTYGCVSCLNRRHMLWAG